MLYSIFLHYNHTILVPPCMANLLSNPLIIFGHIFLLVKIVLKGSSGLHFDQNHCSSVNWPVPNHGNFGPLEKGAFWLKTHCCHLVLLDKHCLGLIPCLVCQRHHPPYWERERDRKRSVTLAMILVINYLGNFCLLLLTLLYLNSLGSRHASLICSAFESFEGFTLMNTEDNVVA